MRTSKTLLAGVLFSAALFLGACSSDPDTPGATGDPSTSDAPGGGGGGNPDQDECLLGTWELDVQDVANQMIGLMGVPGVTAEADGTVTAEFAEDMTVTYDSTVAITMPIGDTPMVGTASYSGSTVHTDWTTTDGVLEGQPGESDFAINMEFSAGGQTVPANMPPPSMGDPGDGNATYTCSGDSLIVAGAPPAPTWRLTRV